MSKKKTYKRQKKQFKKLLKSVSRNTCTPDYYVNTYIDKDNLYDNRFDMGEPDESEPYDIRFIIGEPDNSESYDGRFDIDDSDDDDSWDYKYCDNESIEDTAYDDDAFDDEAKLPADIAYRITKRILRKEILCVVEGTIWRYNNKTGAYSELQDDTSAILIESYYTKDELRLAKPALAAEIKTRICRHPDLQTSYDTFNANPNLINCKNGIIVVGKQKCTLQKHSPDYKFTYCIHAKYLENEKKAEAFATYCETSLGGEKKKIKLLLQIIGYCCSDMTTAKKAFFFKGEPDSGKSMMIHFIEKLVGIEAVSNIPLHGLGERFNKACLLGKKLNTQGEMKNIKLKDISTFKAITGGDRISAEFKHGKIFSYTPTAKLLYAGNALPMSAEPEATKAFMNRICLLLFPNSIPKEMQDEALAEKLWDERNAIFTMAINTLPDLVRKSFKFAEPEDSREYIQYSESTSNSLDMFLDDCCTFNQNASIPVQEFTKAYTSYCERNALEIIGKIKMGSRLLEKHKVRRSRIHRKEQNIHHFIGIQFRKNPMD